MQDESKGLSPAAESSQAEAAADEGHKEIIKLAALLALIAVVVLGATLLICALALRWFEKRPEEAEDMPEEEESVTADIKPGEAAGGDTAEPTEAPAKLLWPAGTAWDTGSGSYYFMEDGGYYYYISDDMADYIKGRISIKEATEEEVRSAGAGEILAGHDEGKLVAIDVLVDKEIYFDREKSGMKYTIYMAGSGDKMSVYDSGWGYVYEGKKAAMPERVKLNDYFEKKAEPGTVETSEGNEREYPFADISFDNESVARSGQHLCADGGRAVYADVITPPEDTEVSNMAAAGGYIYYGAGRRGSRGVRTEALYRAGTDGSGAELLVKDKAEDMLICKDRIYYTDYNRLVCLEKDGSTKDLWKYGVYCFEVAEGNIYLFDGEEWELLDADDGSDKGYISNGINYAYSCDHAVYRNGYLFFSAYDHNRKSVSIRALCAEDGSELILGEEIDGTAEDVCNTAFSGSCIYYTGSDRERLNRLDLKDGSVKSVELSDEGLWYISDMAGTAGGATVCACDRDGNRAYYTVDRELNIKKQ
ncbi:MAG: DUF5050 domain-containing protein [Lachnospiraceae bacterium]|nr:DUF5050 domain-containing protein [Lachnospiraceae bacterium]